jgi:hypothetical protein
MNDMKKGEISHHHEILENIKKQIIEKYEYPTTKKEAEAIAKEINVSTSTIERMFGISKTQTPKTHKITTLNVFTQFFFGKNVNDIMEDNESTEQEMVKKVFDEFENKTLNIKIRKNCYNFDLLCERLELSPEKLDFWIKTIKGTRIKFRKNKVGERLSSLKTVEYFEDNSSYGTFLPVQINENTYSNLTIINPIGYPEKDITYIAHYVAKYLNANYIANEKYGNNVPNHKKRLRFSKNEAYQNIEILNNMPERKAVFEKFCEDIEKVVNENSLVVILSTTNPKRSSFHITFGGNENKNFGFNFPNMTYKNSQKLEIAFQEFKQELQNDDLTLVTHEELGSVYDETHLHYYIHKQHKASVLTIYLNIGMISHPTLHVTNIKVIQLLGNFLKKLV